ncbi:MAG: hypothetical protein AAGL24_10055 [Pseudomonadota bacterium]
MAKGPLDIRGTATLTDRTRSTFRTIGRNLRRLAQHEGLRRVAQNFRRVGGVVLSVGRRVAGLAAQFTALAGAAGALTLGGVVNSYSRATDELAKFARQVGWSVQSMRELSFISDRQGVNFDTAKMAVQRLTRRVGELRLEQGSLYNFLKKNNPALAQQLKNAESSEHAFGIMLGALESTTDQSEKLALAMAAFDTEGVKMVRIAEAGSEGLAGMRDRARELLGELGDKAAATAESFRNSMTDLGTAVTGVRDAIGEKLLPVLAPLIDKLTEWVAKNREIIATKVAAAVESIAAAIESVDWVGVLTSIGDFATGVNDVASALGGWGDAIIMVGGLLVGVMLAPLGLVAAAVGVLGGIILAKWDDIASLLSEAGERIKVVAKGMADGIDAGIEKAVAFAGAQINVFRDNITTGFAGMFSGIESAFDTLAELWKAGLDAAKVVLTDFVNWVKTTFVDPILSAIQSVKDAFRSVANLGSSVSNSIGSLFGGGKPEGRAVGGTVFRDRPYMVGELGPELFVPGRTGTIVTTDVLRRALQSGALGFPQGGGRTNASLDITIKDQGRGTSARYRERGDPLFGLPNFSTGPSMAFAE